MGKPAKWFKNVLLGKKSSKSSNGSKGYERVVSGNELVVTAKVEESDVVSQHVEPEEISDDEIHLPESKPADSQNAAPVQDKSLSDAERIQQEIAATLVQAAFRGYLARRAFWALKGIIRLQALIRGHLVRRQAVSTLCCVMGMVKLQALARGKEIRNSHIGVQVARKCRLKMLQENKVVNSTDAYLGIKKLTANAFALKLLASSPKVMPVHIPYDSSNPNSSSIWLESWSASCFWKPVPQPKKTIGRRVTEAETAKPKKSASVQTSFEFGKHKRSFRKVPSQSVEPPAVEDPQVELEKVKRGLRKVHNPVVESSIRPQPVPHIEVEETKHETIEEAVKVFEENKKQEVPEQPDEVEVHTPGPLETNEALDSSLVNQIGEAKDATEEKTTKPNSKESSAGKENQKSRRKGSATNKTEREESNGHHHQTSPSIPSYMQATKSAKAKLRLQGSPKSAEQDGTEKANVPRRHSLPSSGNGRMTSSSPRTTRLASSGDKTGNKKEKPLLSSAKTTPVERKR
ncbi:protein IQ-DOMAIN 31 [Brassica rapa]|uniref:DUF4005 domain-containing protein n=1 Tax=Brassica campestris TaxID=3711 RepID=M4CVB6_BRACM|nr:protein IQ-DOMAIN 31 [Brassica rapa]XP_009128058.1 protein IQ-DOMAIN 31 [Brassica rapa]XP_033140099.1 protein IQ-DOMAIN 31 [Brassica rapa]